jgi:hypothetical protein
MTKRMSMAIKSNVTRIAPTPIPMAAPVERPLLLGGCAGACVDVAAELIGATVIAVTEVSQFVSDVIAAEVTITRFVIPRAEVDME